MVLSCGVGRAWAAEPLVIGVPNYVPFYDAQGDGLLSELFVAAFQAEGIEVQIRPMPIRRGVKSLIEHDIDAYAAGNLFADAKQLERLKWVPVINALPSWFYLKTHIDQLPSNLTLEDLRTYRLGVIVNSPYLERYRELGLDIVEIQSPQQMVGMTERGRIDMFEATLLTGLLMFKDHSSVSWSAVGYVNWDVLPLTLAFAAERQRSLGLSQRFQQGVAKLQANGELQALLERYWGEGNIPPAVLKPALSQKAVTLDLEKFWSRSRTATGKIAEQQR